MTQLTSCLDPLNQNLVSNAIKRFALPDRIARNHSIICLIGLFFWLRKRHFAHLLFLCFLFLMKNNINLNISSDRSKNVFCSSILLLIPFAFYQFPFFLSLKSILSSTRKKKRNFWNHLHKFRDLLLVCESKQNSICLILLRILFLFLPTLLLNYTFISYHRSIEKKNFSFFVGGLFFFRILFFFQTKNL